LPFTYDFIEIDGRVPMVDFLDSLSVRERAKIYAYMEKLVELKNQGMQPKENLSKHLDDGIFELRVNFENRISRNLYFYETDRQILFTHGFVKKQQKTPHGEIAKAKSMRGLWRGDK
jgi:phage-related protein